MADPVKTRKPTEEDDDHRRTLWRARLRPKNEFMFRETADFNQAVRTAQKLLEESRAARMIDADIVAVERVAALWN